MIETPAVGEVGKEGDMVTLRCSAYGSPAPQFTWTPSGKEVESTTGENLPSFSLFFKFSDPRYKRHHVHLQQNKKSHKHRYVTLQCLTCG